MGVFEFFKIAQMVPNREKRLILKTRKTTGTKNFWNLFPWIVHNDKGFSRWLTQDFTRT